MEDFELEEFVDDEQSRSSSMLFHEVNSFFLTSEMDSHFNDNSRNNSPGLLSLSERTSDADDDLRTRSQNTSSSASSTSLPTISKKRDADDHHKVAPKKKFKSDKVTAKYSDKQAPVTSGLLDFPRKLTKAFNEGHISEISKLIDNYCVDKCKLVTIVSDNELEGKVYIKEYFKKLLEVSPDSVITFHNEVFIDNNTINAKFSCTGTVVEDAEEQAKRLFFKDGIVLSDKVVDTSKLSKDKIAILKELENELKKQNKPIVHITNGLSRYSYTMCDDGIERITACDYNWRTSMIKDGTLET